jgi:hypothetical protein
MEMIQMALSTSGFLNGISAMIVFIIGVLYGVKFLLYYLKLKKKFMPLVIILGLGVGCFYLGPTTSFLSLLISDSNIDGYLYAKLSYTHAPILILVAMYLGFDVFNPKLRNKVVSIFIVLAVVFWVVFLGFPELSVKIAPDIPGEIRDISFNGLALVLIATYLLSVLIILGGNFLKLSKKIKGEEQRKAKSLGYGWIMFTISGILDTIMTPELIVIARILMIVAAYLVFSGFMPDKSEIKK